MIEIGKKFFYRGLKAKKAKIRLGMWGILHFNYQVKKETISGEAARIQYVHLKANYSFSHKFSFSKIWPERNRFLKAEFLILMIISLL